MATAVKLKNLCVRVTLPMHAAVAAAARECDMTIQTYVRRLIESNVTDKRKVKQGASRR